MPKECEGYANVDLSKLPKLNNGYIDWKHSIGKSVSFSVKDFSGILFIKKYIQQPNRSVGTNLLVIYQNQEYIISVTSLRSGYLPFLNIPHVYNKSNSIKWKYEIGQRIVTDKKDITIIDRRFDLKASKQLYKILCNKCGFDSGEHYYLHKYQKEYWIHSDKLYKLIQCPCCRINTKIVKPGINDVATTAPWLIPFFKGGIKEAEKYCKTSKIVESGLCCPDCGRDMDSTKLCQIYTNKSNSCPCQDGVSYPNKFLYYFLEQLKDHLQYCQTEYSPSWIGKKRYDGYLEINDKKYIIELDGGLGHGNWSFSNIQDKEGLEIDKYKDEQAKKHGINVIRIPCLQVSFNNLKKSFYIYLESILPLNVIDWDKLQADCFKNRNKEICMYYENNSKDIKKISFVFNLHMSNVKKALQEGKKLGWCPSYKNRNDIRSEKRKKAIALKEKDVNISSTKTGEICDLSPSTVVRIWKQNGLFDHEKEEKNRLIKSIQSNMKNGHSIDIYDGCNYIATCNSVTNTIKYVKDNYNIDLHYQSIYKVCSGKCKSYKGFIFKYS